MIELCLTTFDIDMIKISKEKYPINCYAMNPSIAVNTHKENEGNFLKKALQIRELIGEKEPFFLQVTGQSSQAMIEEGRWLKQNIPGNTFVKIPASKEGFRAISVLTKEGIECSCTAIFNANQAILAAVAGAKYVAVYVSRLNSFGENGLEVIKEIKTIFEEHNIKTKICAASLKTTQQIKQSILIGAENVTVDYNLLESMAEHPLTDPTLETFKKDWDGLYGVDKKIYDMTV